MCKGLNNNTLVRLIEKIVLLALSRNNILKLIYFERNGKYEPSKLNPRKTVVSGPIFNI